jgi:hypothetical protein
MAETKRGLDRSAAQPLEREAPVSLHLQAGFRNNGPAAVLSAHELTGVIRLRTRATSRFIYEVQGAASETLAVEPLFGDPFMGRGADDPERRLPPGTFEVEKTVLPLSIPAPGVARALSCGIRVSLYQIDDLDPLPPITPETIEELRPRLRLVSSGRVSGPELRRMLRSFDAEGPVERFGT